MNIILFSSYLLTITAIITTPGPNVLLMASHAIKYGKRASVLNAIGSACAALILITLALFGMQNAIPKTFLPVLAIAGACYLVCIGISNIVKNMK